MRHYSHNYRFRVRYVLQMHFVMYGSHDRNDNEIEAVKVAETYDNYARPEN